MATDMSDVLIAWGKSPGFWFVLTLVLVFAGAILDAIYNWGVVASAGGFFADSVDVLKAVITGGAL